MGKSKFLLVISICLFISSISFLLFPYVNNLLYQHSNESTIKQYDNNISSLSKNEKDKYLEEAKLYNESLTNSITDKDLVNLIESVNPEYENILNFNNGQICSIEIPKINVALPVYHGTSEDVLEYGASHSANTSFPIGGVNTHAVISAHTAYPAKIFFDNLTELTIGDKFYINILDEQLTYKVCDINIVEPDDTSLLQIEYQKDLITLVTCYPYAVNSHRLLVRGERTSNNNPTIPTESSTAYTNTDNNGINTELIQVIVLCIYSVGLVPVIILLIIFIIKNIKNGDKNEKNTNKKSR